MNPHLVTLNGSGHWSVCRLDDPLKSNLWTWWLEIEGVTVKDGKKLLSDEEMDVLSIRKDRGPHLIRNLGPFLPESVSTRILEPEHVPGDDATISIPLMDFNDPEGAANALVEFFPELYQLARAV